MFYWELPTFQLIVIYLPELSQSLPAETVDTSCQLFSVGWVGCIFQVLPGKTILADLVDKMDKGKS